MRLPKSLDPEESRNTDLDPFTTTKINLRTGVKLIRYCSVYGDPGDKHNLIEVHHLRHIYEVSKKGKVSGFLDIMKALNRKIVLVCRQCHNKIHKGAASPTMAWH